MENQTELTIRTASFPVVFFDGHIEVNIGNILVYPFLLFHSFKAVICQKLGIPPHQILTYLVRKKNARSSPEIPWKVLIDESSDFAAIARERDCFVLAILNPPRTNRLLRSGERGKSIAVETEAIVSEATSLMRFPANALNVDVPVSVGLRHWNYECQLQNMQREKHPMFREEAYTPLKAADTEMERVTSSGMGVAAAKPVVCEECAAAKKDGRSADFHPCVLDPVVVGFRTKAGPIQRPSKKHLGA